MRMQAANHHSFVTVINNEQEHFDSGCHIQTYATGPSFLLSKK